MGCRFLLSRTLQSLILLGVLVQGSYGQKEIPVKYDKLFFSTWRIEDPALIDSILTEFMFPKENVQVIEFIDINENGIDRLDVLRLTPENKNQKNSSQNTGEGIYQVYALSDIEIPESVKHRAANWDLGKQALKQAIIPNLEVAKRWHEDEKSSKSSLVVTFLTAILQNYKKNEFKLMLERDDKGMFKFYIVGFDEDSTTYNKPWDPNSEMPETLTGSEVMRAFFENIKKEFQNELVIMHRERRDTVYISNGKGR